jgi:hypothetical protein
MNQRSGLRGRTKASTVSLAVAVLSLVLAPAPIFAQWIDTPTAGVPRTAKGEPDLGAPAPRAASGKPDLSGIWFSIEFVPECSAAECIPQGVGLPLDATNIGRTLPDGLPYQPWAAALVATRTANRAQDDPHAHCLPPNFPRAFSFPHYFKILTTPQVTVILHEFNATYRQIFTDGRALPVDPNPYWQGYSSGRWEGDTLVVETIGFRDDLWLDLSGSPLTSAAHVTERFKRVDYGHLQIELTVNDPKAYTRPWTVTLTKAIVLDTDLVEEVCLENEQDTRLFGAK